MIKFRISLIKIAILAILFIPILPMANSSNASASSYLKIIKGHYIEDDGEGGIAVVLICDYGPGFCKMPMQ
jgi:hypothetical protein